MVNKEEGTKEQTTTLNRDGIPGPDLFQSVKIETEAAQKSAQLQLVVEAIGKAVNTDAYAPPDVARKTEAAGVTKCARDAMSTVILGLLAGVFIGFGAMFCTLVTTGNNLGFGITKLVGGLAFCLGLILVVVAGAELFTGNTLIVMSWISGRTSLARLLRNWGLVYFANLAGALSLVAFMFYTNQWSFNNNGVGANALAIANAKVNLSFGTALVRGIMCNALVCLAIWLCFSARTVVDKIVAIIFPITAFVAGGFEHSIANMYFIPMGILLGNNPAVMAAAGLTADKVANLTWGGFVNNLVPVTIGNIIGGAVLIGVVYWLAYLSRERRGEMVTARPWLKIIMPNLATVGVARPAPQQLPEPVRAEIAELIRVKMGEPVPLAPGARALLAVLDKAKDDASFLARLAEKPAEALAGFDLTAEEKAALASGDIRWIESKLGTLGEPLRNWLNARLAQEKW